MKLANAGAIWLCIFSFALASQACTGVNEAPQGVGSDRTGPQSSTERSVATAPFSFSGGSEDYVAVVREAANPSEIPIRRIGFFTQGRTSPQFEFETPDGFVGFWPDNGEWCATLWSTGSGMVLRVFGPTSSGIGLLLEKGLQLPPEVVDLDGDGKNELIVTSGRLLVSNGETLEEPSSCLVLKWSAPDHRFDQVRTVPWNKRQDLFGKVVK